MLGQPLRPGDIRQAAVENRLEQRVAARHRVADHVHVGLQVELAAVVAFDQPDALLLELGAHRRIHVGVAAGHGMAGCAREQRNAAHEGAADAEDMDVHGDFALR